MHAPSVAKSEILLKGICKRGEKKLTYTNMRRLCNTSLR